jgi:REP element-mobilizing transposase RayT
MAAPQTDRNFPKRHRLSPDAYADRSATFHLTLRAFPGTTPFSGNLGQDAWNTLLQQTVERRVQIHAACLMPDHLHLVVSPGSDEIVHWVGRFKSYTTHLARLRGWRGKLWQPSFHDRALREGEFDGVVEYVRRNPVEAGLVGEPENWPWLFVGD